MKVSVLVVFVGLFVCAKCTFNDGKSEFEPIILCDLKLWSE
jgi:hypothetical protein